MPGGPTDDDGWGDAADEQTAPVDDGWGDDEPASDAIEAGEIQTAEPLPEPPPERPRVSLTEAVGVEALPEPPRRSRRRVFLAVALIVLAIGLGVGGVLSYFNHQRLYLACGDQDVRAERGRWFLWGRAPLEGERWKSFELPGVCDSREVDSMSELESAFLELLVTRASALLAAENPDPETTEGLLEQGLSLARAPEHKPQRAELERLRGDVEYWRGRAEITGAIERLKSARQHYDEAVKIGPRHAGDADRWVSFIDRLLERVGAGPGGTIKEDEVEAPGIDRDEPTVDAAPPATPVVIPDAGPDRGPEPDAGVPRGGVLL